MNILTFVGSLLAAFIKSLFCKSKEERLGASEEKVKILEKHIAVESAMKSTKKISKKDQLLNVLRKGKLILIYLSMSVCACSTTPAIVCQDVKEWTREEQIEMVLDLKGVSANSPLVGAMTDYFNMREEARVCKKQMGM